jgi:mono/diheme cytochrome c family protein
MPAKHLPFLALALALALAIPLQARVDFNREVRPLLAKHCFACHGPDKEARKAKLRLDTFEGATGSSAIVPGHIDKSDLVYRIETDDKDDRMPPSSTNSESTPTNSPSPTKASTNASSA